jgi:hypothetical protein
MNRWLQSLLAMIGGFIGGFVVAEVLMVVGFRLFGWVMELSFLTLLLPLVGAGVGFMLVRPGRRG